jgi:hypothetical protein
MKNLTLVIGAACTVGLLAANALAQSGTARATSPLPSDTNQYQAAGYAYADTPAAAPATPPAAAPATPPAAAPATPPAAGANQPPPPPPDKAYGDQGAKKDEAKKDEAKPAEEEAKPEEPKPWQIPQPCILSEHRITLGGWFEQGANTNFNGTSWNGVVPFDDHTGYQLNQFWMFLDRPTDTSKCDWDWGGHVDVCFGTDPRFFKDAVGLEQSWDETGPYQLALPQFYTDLAHDDWVFRFGHFVTLLSYEVIQSPQNFFYSHSYQFSYAVPYTHTGALAIKKFGQDKEWSITTGITQGNDVFFDDPHPNFLGGIAYTQKDGKSSLAFNITTGEEAEGAAPDVYQTIYSLVAMKKLNDKPAGDGQLKYVIEHDLGIQTGAVSGQWYGIGNYLLYDINKCWQAGMRAEWFRDNNGIRVADPYAPSPVSVVNGASFAGNFYEFTWGLNWKPNLNVTIRPEIRYDWYQGPASPNGLLPYGNGNFSHQGMIACDGIFTF